ncbi:MAG: error-prone polymerase [Nocardioidaceae bacterium]|nr:error-prone polymerase [Nocardioidaceae bacterium]
MLADLHTHSSRSDGTTTPTELVTAAKAAGLDVVALTDHDTADGWAEAAEAAARVGITLVRGMELSTKYDGHSVHLLAYLPDPTYPPLVAELARINDGRTERMPTMVRNLQLAGHAITAEDVLAVSSEGAVLGRPHVADALVRNGVVASRDEAFATLLGPGGVGYVRRYGAPLQPTIDLVREAGGVAVIAHPRGRGLGLADDAIAELSRHSLTGIEVDHQGHSPQDRAELRALAADLGLVATGSSDYHGAGKVDHELGCNTTAPEQLERLLDAAERSRLASGRPAPAVLPA